MQKRNHLMMEQILIRFQDKTHAISIPKNASFVDDGERNSWLISLWSERTGWPCNHLRVLSWNSPFLQLSTVSSIRGGKGGFGTLLKGQSKQAGAKLTTDFGACRDLQGRRLRHVNDEIKLRKWRDMEKRKQAGEKVADDELWSTPSGIYNWHLMTPTWADISKKQTYRIKRQFRKLDKQAQKEAELKKEKDEVYQKSMTMYLDQATAAVETIQQGIPDAIKQGLAAANNKKRRRSDAITPIIEETPNSLCTLSGDIVVIMNDKSKSAEIQSKSDFGTAVLVLDSQPPCETPFIYYEVTLVTGGLAQIGWAYLVGDHGFCPNDDLGDGCGDDAASFGVDGSRQLKFHAGGEDSYPLRWKEGDRLGCLFDAKNGVISYTLNGTAFGEAFTTKMNPLVPAISCNQGQILELHTTKEECTYFPNADAVAVNDLLIPREDDPNEKKTEKIEFEMVRATVMRNEAKKSAPNNGGDCQKKPAKGATKPELLDLGLFQSAQELEKLGLDRLKSALIALHVKCGGTLTERAVRLFSLKGLNRNNFPKKVRTKRFVS